MKRTKAGLPIKSACASTQSVSTKIQTSHNVINNTKKCKLLALFSFVQNMYGSLYVIYFNPTGTTRNKTTAKELAHRSAYQIQYVNVVIAYIVFKV
jgi:hypothetical protein